METQDSGAFRELLRLLVRSLGLLEKTDSSGGAATITQCHALVEIGRRKSINLIDLAELLGLSKSTMSRIVQRMQKAGLITRSIDESNRRYIVIRLTENGTSIYQEVEQSSGGYYKSVFDLIPQEKQGQVLESLSLVTEALKRKGRNGAE
jgi:DNA-binding MarR family transcriptional regulator